MPENGRPVANFFFCGCVLALTLWNNIKLSEENEFTKNDSNSLIEDSEAKSLPQSDAESLQFRAPNPQNTQSNWMVIENTTECLGLSNISNEGIEDLKQLLSKFNKKSRLQNLTLENILITWKDFITILEIVWQTSVEYFNIHNMTQLDNIKKQHFIYVDTSLKALTIDKVSITDLYFTQTNLYLVFSEMNILALTISDSKMLHMLCPSTISPFQYLSFANNEITDLLFKDCKTLVHLETLILRKNQFRELSKVSSMTREMRSLKYLDMSQNPLKCDEEQKKHCSWTETLVKLNLSSNKLTDSVFKCLPLYVQILDLQNNQISTIPKEITELEALSELNIAFNRLTDLPGCRHFSALEFLNIEMNQILTPSSDLFQSCQNIRRLKAGLNPFECSCVLQDFINHAKQSSSRLGGWPEMYVCEYPKGWKGTQLKDFHLSKIACNTALLLVTVLIITVVLVALVSFLCIYFDAPWYLKMMWQWTQTKQRVWNRHPDELPSHLQFHAFISYSEHDSLWVKNDLIPNLEREEGSVQLCVHERNFIPGKSIVENIINCIEKSYKSIFVLSPNFVQSEWCHYELYFAHHKLFSESSNSLILILLEPIPQYIIPVRYHKLKALMAKRTYLEWPKEKSKHRLFWANLRAAINLNLPVSVERS